MAGWLSFSVIALWKERGLHSGVVLPVLEFSPVDPDFSLYFGPKRSLSSTQPSWSCWARCSRVLHTLTDLFYSEISVFMWVPTVRSVQV